MLVPMLAGFAIMGCSSDGRTRSAEDISVGDERLADVDEMRKVEDETSDDYDKMTRVDSQLLPEALAEYDKAIQDDPTNAEAYYARGFAQLSHGDAMLKAIEDFTKAIELNPAYARAYLMRGRAYEAVGDREKAEADQAKAVELEPNID
jgi:tetratricopeptide (TPR) repeat protein